MYLVLQICASAIILPPSPHIGMHPLAMMYRNVHKDVMANLGPNSGMNVIYGITMNNAADVEVEWKMLPGRVCAWLVH